MLADEVGDIIDASKKLCPVDFVENGTLSRDASIYPILTCAYETFEGIPKTVNPVQVIPYGEARRARANNQNIARSNFALIFAVDVSTPKCTSDTEQDS